MNTPFVTLKPINFELFKNHKVGIFIDVSGSTGSVFGFRDHNNSNPNQKTILDIEKSFASHIMKQIPNCVLVAWDTESKQIAMLDELKPNGGTEPSCNFTNQTVKNIIDSLEIMILLTDGEIGISEINKFSNHITTEGLHLKAVIGVMVGSKKPVNDVNVSVLIPTMIANSCIIYNDNENLHVMWSSGSFKNEWNPVDLTDGIFWDEITKVTIDQICNNKVCICSPDEVEQLTKNGYIPFGSGLFFNSKYFLEYQPSWDVLLELPLDRICQYFKINGRYDDLVIWFGKQKERFISEFGLSLKDQKALNDLVINIVNNGHQKNSDHVNNYIQARNRYLSSASINYEEAENLITDNRVKKLANFIRRIMTVVEEDKQTINDISSYSAPTFSSSRYDIGATVCKIKSDSSKSNQNNSCDFSKPLRWYYQFLLNNPSRISNKVDCSICCENSVPFFLIRKKFALKSQEFSKIPLEYLYHNPLCYKCAQYFCEMKHDPVRVECIGAMPIVVINKNAEKEFLDAFENFTTVTVQQKSVSSWFAPLSYISSSSAVSAVDNDQTKRMLLHAIGEELFKLHNNPNKDDNLLTALTDFIKNFN